MDALMNVVPDALATTGATTRADTGAGPQESSKTGPPLAGITIVDLSRVLAGPFATMLLGDLGADVIKVERPGVGDDTRQWGPPFVGPQGSQESTYYLSANRNKRSIVLDLRAPDDLAVLKKLLRSADVVVENFRPGVMDRLGLSAAVLSELNPALVSLSISGFGSQGPDRERVGYDQILQAEGGLMSLTGLEVPTRVGVPVADLTAGFVGVIGILAALVERTTSGRGQQVQTSLLASVLALHTFQATRYLIGGEVPGKSGNHHPTVAPYGLFWAADGPLVIAVENQDIWRRFAPLMGLDVVNPAYIDNAARLANAASLERRVNERLSEHAIQHWIEIFAAAQVPAGEVRSLDRVYSDPHLLAEGLLTEVDHPTLGPIRLPGNPLRFSRSAAPTDLPPPLLGEHSVEIRAAQ